MTDFDSPWKESLEVYFEQFMALFFPQAHEGIDWKRGYEFLDKELQRVTRDAKVGRRTADKLIKVWLFDGLETWILVHVEVQAQEDPNFVERMFIYHYRIFDRYHRQVVSLAVLADDVEKWRPEAFSYGLWGCRMRFDYPMIKLLDYRSESDRPPAWEGNPFGVIVEAHLMVLNNRRDPDKLFASKFELVKKLYTAGWNRQEIVDLFRFIDWLMALPKAHENLFWEALSRYEEVRKMPYVTSVERIGIEKGIQQGIQQGVRQGLLDGIELALEVKFGVNGLSLMPVIRKIEDIGRLQAVKERIRTAGNISDLKALVLESENTR